VLKRLDVPEGIAQDQSSIVRFCIKREALDEAGGSRQPRVERVLA
jgi:hypothetical protein